MCVFSAVVPIVVLSMRFCSQEVIEVVRKLLLTGILVQFEKGSSLQIVLACGIIIIHMILLAHFKPYRKIKHTMLALFVYLAMLFVFFGGLLLSIQASLGSYNQDHAFLSGLSTDRIAVLLIVFLLSVLIVAIAIALDEMRVAASSIVLQYESNREPVRFSSFKDETRFHFFLSHVWSTGQDQVQAIKKELQLIVPSLKIWLDVEK